jgi:hypothetical protein
MKRPITYAELLLIMSLVIGGFQVAPHVYRFISDRVSIEVKLK